MRDTLLPLLVLPVLREESSDPNLVKALHDYKSGVRSGGAGAAMSDVAYPLSDEEITALAHYLAYLQN